jgi:DNA repair exonuclease SbcCD nuclease subunit
LRLKFFDELEKRQIDTHLIVGNHDTPFKNTNYPNAASMILDLPASWPVHVHASPSHQTFDGLKVLMIPWMNSSNRETTLNYIADSDASVAIGHLEVSGFKMYKHSKESDGLDIGLFKKFNAVFSGHYHHRGRKGNVMYLGSPYEITWNDYDDPRGFHVFDTETLALKFIQNPERMFHKIPYPPPADFKPADYRDRYVKVIVEDRGDEKQFDAWVKDFESTGEPKDLEVIDAEQITYAIDDQEVDDVEDTLSILYGYVRGMTTEADKAGVEQMLHRLYVDAMTMDDEI